ncbi:hypothetical protein IKQ26_10020 [bacterium]|nr:hypothetical protein [bacterium]
MSFETRYSLSQLMSGDAQGKYGIRVDNIGRFQTEKAEELERENTPWLNAYTGPQGGTNGEMCPDIWTEGDTFLRTKLGTKVRYKEEKVYPSCKHVITKTVGRYSSPLAQSLLQRQKKAVLSEQYLMEDVDIVEDSLDLRKTEIVSLPKLKEVGGNLTLDTNSRLGKLPELKQVKGKITVIAKNKDEMNDYLRRLGLIDGYGQPKVSVGKGVELFMRSYA